MRRQTPPTRRMLPYNSTFQAPWWCKNPHLQTIWPYLFGQRPRLGYRRERLELRDGDFIDIDWLDTDAEDPVALLIHGLCGDSSSHYVRGLAVRLHAAGIRVAVMHHRGCSGEPNRLPRSYHGGDWTDIDRVLLAVRRREPHAPLFAAGFSIGGSMLLNWLSRNRGLLTAACAVSTPLDLGAGVARMQAGLSRMYQAYLVSEMKSRLRRKSKRVELPFDMSALARVRTFPAFDDLVTAPLHGFDNADDYYTRCSSRPVLCRIGTPTLVIHAADDPLATPATVPEPDHLPQDGSVVFELSRRGGHCGFISGSWPHRAAHWTDGRITGYFTSFLRSPEGQALRPPERP